MWAGSVPALSKNFQFISIDLPGFGASAGLDETASMDAMAEQVLSTLDHLNIKDKCVLSGLSMGGYVMFPLLKRAPERFRAAAFISTRSGADSDEGRAKRFQNIDFINSSGMAAFADRMAPVLLGKTSLETRLSVVAEVKTLIQSQQPFGVCAALRGMADRPDSMDLLESLRIPALFLAGQEDAVIPASEMEGLSKKVKKSEFHSIAGAGHLLNFEQPALFHDLFLHFLKRRVL